MSLFSRLVAWKFKTGDDKRDAGLTTPEEVRRFDGIQYGPDPKWNRLDLYKPKDADGPVPVIVSVHGGGWVYGDKERYQYYCMSLVKHGFAVVNFTYGLAPEFKYPGPLTDSNRVIEWLLSHGEEYGLDTARVFAVGDSAGAHLLGLYCCAVTNPAYAEKMPFTVPEGFLLTAVALNCGVYRLEKNRKEDRMRLLMLLIRDFLPGKGTEEELREIDVHKQATEAFPPAFIITAEGDYLAGQAMPMAERLRALGVPVEYHYYGDSEHVLVHDFHCNMRNPVAEVCNRDECMYFRGFLA